MKIVFIHHGHELGGAAISLHNLLKGLIKKGVAVDVINSVGRKEVDDFFRDACLKVKSKRIWYFPHNSLSSMPINTINGIYNNLKWLMLYPLSCLNLFLCLVNSGYDIVHFNSASLIVYGWIPRILGKKLVCHIREPFAEGALGIRRFVLRKCLYFFTHQCIAICEDNKRDTALSESRCKLIYNPVDFEKFNDSIMSARACRESLNIKENSLVVLFAGGSNAKVKGVVDFLISMDIVRQKFDDLICLMPSFKPSAIKEDSAMQAYSNLKTHIIQKPFVTNIESWIGASDIVYALHKEPHFSRTIVEAGAMKKPVIAYDIGGISEVIKDQVNGLLCPVGDIEGIANATILLHTDKLYADKLSQGGHKRTVRDFDSRVHVEKVLSLFKAL